MRTGITVPGAGIAGEGDLVAKTLVLKDHLAVVKKGADNDHDKKNEKEDQKFGKPHQEP